MDENVHRYALRSKGGKNLNFWEQRERERERERERKRERERERERVREGEMGEKKTI